MKQRAKDRQESGDAALTPMAPASPQNMKVAGDIAVPSPRPLPAGEGELGRAPGATFTVRRPASGQGLKLAAVASILFAFSTASGKASAEIQFEDVSTEANMTYVGESYGASWGDKNGDGLPDLFVNNHRNQPSIYVNRGDGTFEDRWYEVSLWRSYPRLDQHGAAWSDFDGDGDRDLFVSLGARDWQQFLVSNGEVLQDRTQEYAFAVKGWEGRQPLWSDFTHDGWLDFILSNRGGNAQAFIQNPGQAANVTFTKLAFEQHRCAFNQYFQLTDLIAEGPMELICPSQTEFPQRIDDISTLPFTDITDIVPTVDDTTDSITADFDGNGEPDLLVLRGALRTSGAVLAGENSDQIESFLAVDSGKETGIEFVSSGDIVVRIFWDARNASDVHIGAEGWTVSPQPKDQPLLATLSSSDPAVVGIQAHDSTLNKGIYIGFEPGSQKWTLLMSSGGDGHSSYFYVDSTAEISEINVTGRTGPEFPMAPVLLLNQHGLFSDQTAGSGLEEPLPCISGVAGDFDNDMDSDLFLVCRGSVTNLEDRLYENLGDGTFALVTTSGAEGPTGLGVGVGENVVVADYDVDGFLDLFVTNGLMMLPLEPNGVGGPDKLFRNFGNSNHWVELDLVGTVANRDAVGAKVYVRAGGVTQVVEQNGGYHRWAQNSQRLHVGLGANSTADIEVHWPLPSTRVDVYPGVSAGQLYRVVEGEGVAAVTLPETVPPSACVDPGFDPGTESGVFLWKDCDLGTWFMRFAAGGLTRIYAGAIVSEQALSNVTGLSIESDDVLDYTSDPSTIAFSLNVAGTGIDGVDFGDLGGADTCLSLVTPAGVPVQVGHLRTPLVPPFDLNTMGHCNNLRPTISITGGTVSEAGAAGVATFTLNLSAASSAPVTVDVMSADGTAVAPGDYAAVPLTTVTFDAGETSKVVSVAIINDLLVESNETFTLTLSHSVNALLGTATATATISDDDSLVCNRPVYDKATERAVFLWMNCSDGSWHARMTGGVATAVFQGTVVADRPLSSVVGFSIESSDVLNYTANPTTITYQLIASAAAQDGFDFTFPAGAGVCFTLAAPASMPVYVGVSRIQVASPFDLSSLGACRPVPTISIDDVTVDEGAGSASFTVSLSGANPAGASVDYATVDGSATAGADYSAIATTTLSFAPGETTQQIVVAITDDSVFGEGAETFSVALSNPVGASLADTAAVGTITDNDTLPTLSIEDVTVDEGAGSASFTVSLSAANPSGASVDYATVDGSATAGADYSAIAATTLSFAPGETTQQIVVAILEDSAFGEGAETFSVALSNPVGASLADTAAVGTITDNDTLPTLSIQDVTVDEGAGSASFTVSLSRANPAGASVDYATVDGSATAGADYSAIAATTLSFAPGETTQQIVVAILEDSAFGEGAETFSVALSNPVGASLADTAAVGTITDNDTLPTLSIEDVTVDEGAGSASFTVSLSGANPAGASVDYATVDGSATAGADYGAIATTTLSFAPGETTQQIVVAILEDSAFGEGAETFSVALSNPVGASLADTAAVGTITDNDTLACGQPAYNKAQEQAVFLWKNCTDGHWYARMTAGGGTVTYQGTIVSDQSFTSVAGYSIESSDMLNYTSDPRVIAYRLTTSATYEDGFAFRGPTDQGVCFTLSTPSTLPVYVGAARTRIDSPFNLATLAGCNQL